MKKGISRRITAALLTILLLAAMIPCTLAASPKVTVTSQKVCLNGEIFQPMAYNIDGSNYFRLRDMACYLADTSAEFNVTYDSASDTINITTGAKYTPIGTEKAALQTPRSVVKSHQKLKVDGVSEKIDAYNIDGSNFFKLRDLAVLGFEVSYNEKTRIIDLTTEPEEPVETPSLTDLKGLAISVSCSSINYATLTVKNNTDDFVTFTVKPGTYFGAKSSSVQNMLITEYLTDTLSPGEEKSYTLDTCCMNIHRDIPSSGNGFDLKFTNNEKLAKLAAYLHENDVPYAVRQAAVWIITDNATYGDCGILVSGSTPVISRDIYQQAKQIVNSL